MNEATTYIFRKKDLPDITKFTDIEEYLTTLRIKAGFMSTPYSVYIHSGKRTTVNGSIGSPHSIVNITMPKQDILYFYLIDPNTRYFHRK